MNPRLVITALFLLTVSPASVPAQGSLVYKVLATSKTSTMQQEMQEAGAAGYRFVAVMGGETAMGGNEVVVLMEKQGNDATKYEYRLLATNRTSTLQKELQELGDQGFAAVAMTVGETAIGGAELVVITRRKAGSGK